MTGTRWTTALAVLAAALPATAAEAATTRVSVGPGGEQPNDESFGGQPSGNGRFVLFGSRATNLVPGDANGEADGFLRDMRTGRIVRVNRPAERPSGFSAISRDGRTVMYGFERRFCTRLMLFERGRRRLVPMRRGEGDTFSVVGADLSPDGRYVASLTGHLTPGVTCEDAETSDDGPSDTVDIELELFDRRSGRVRRVPTRGLALDEGLGLALSGGGRRVVVSTSRVSGVTGRRTSRMFAIDTRSGRRSLVNVDSRERSRGNVAFATDITPNGRYVAFDANTALVPGDSGDDWDVYVRDLRRGRTVRASVGTGGAGLGNASQGFLSADGRSIAFVAGDVYSVENELFVRDLRRRTTRSLGVNAFIAGISADGRSVGFTARGDGIVPGDDNGFPDVFLHRR